MLFSLSEYFRSDIWAIVAKKIYENPVEITVSPFINLEGNLCMGIIVSSYFNSIDGPIKIKITISDGSLEYKDALVEVLTTVMQQWMSKCGIESDGIRYKFDREQHIDLYDIDLNESSANKILQNASSSKKSYDKTEEYDVNHIDDIGDNCSDDDDDDDDFLMTLTINGEPFDYDF